MHMLLIVPATLFVESSTSYSFVKTLLMFDFLPGMISNSLDDYWMDERSQLGIIGTHC